MKCRRWILAALSGAWMLTPVRAHEDHPTALEEVLVYGRAQTTLGAAQSASEGVIDGEDIQQVPRLRIGELVESVPGMVATQHSGSGKANQYFLRGFNLDHGTDFSAVVEGVPINMRTHGHGQGYLDLNFLIPELVETTSYRKGPYTASVGDFSSAGSVEFAFYERLAEALAEMTVGEDAYYRAITAGSFDFGPGVVTGAVDTVGYDGPWALEENLEQHRLFLSYAFDLGAAHAKLTLQGYDGEWDATDQIPRRAVQSGLIDELGFIDPDLGGQTARYTITGALDFDAWEASAYLIDYDFTLYSNFTYMLDDPFIGDEFEQRDRRLVYGANIDGGVERFLAGRPVLFRWGADVRYDDIGEVGLYQTNARMRTDIVRQDSVEELSWGAFGQAEINVTDQLRAMIGARADYYDWDTHAFRPDNGGSGNDQLVSPKISFAYRFTENLEGYANWGKGFHSNDVRGTTITMDPRTGDPVEQVAALVQSEGAEIGLRFEPGQHFNATLAAFWLELDSELIFVGDAGATEPNDGTRRVGLEASGSWQATEWLALDGAYTFSEAEFKTEGGGRKIPGAVESTFTLGLNAAWANGLNATARVRYLGEAPLTEDDSVRASDSLLVNTGIGYRRGDLELRLDAFNLLDSDDDDISYFYASRLPGEPPDGVEDVHFHPFEPRTIRASVTMHW